METEQTVCPLCQRTLSDPMSKHHRIPLSQGGTGEDFVMMHRICHSKVHSVFNEKELARTYTSVEKFLENEDIQKFVNWVKKKDLDFYDGSFKAKK